MDPGPSSTAARLIARAASLVGDSQKVIEHLKCSQSDFLDYSAGRRRPSGAEMERLVYLIIREQGIIAARNRDLLAKIRAKIAYMK